MKISKKYDYIRISFKPQKSNLSVEFQKQKLIQNEILETNILVEIGSAADFIPNWPIFQSLIEGKLNVNDLLMVVRINRCSRNTLEFLKLQYIFF